MNTQIHPTTYIINYAYKVITGKDLVIDGRNVLTGKYVSINKPVKKIVWLTDMINNKNY